ncbi:MAG: MoaD/ThiS family protein [Pseudomonadota bacterium]
MKRVCFFASLRELVGNSQIHVSAKTWSDLDEQLQQCLSDEAYQAIKAENVRVALDQVLCEQAFEHMIHQDELISAEEIAFLPPVTGG